MKLPRLLLLIGATLSIAGCTTSRFTKFRAVNPRGETIAEWTARGGYYPVSSGYRITAVERISGEPSVVESHYPYGWPTTVTGAHIVRWHTNEPDWLYDFEHSSGQTTSEGGKQPVLLSEADR